MADDVKKVTTMGVRNGLFVFCCLTAQQHHWSLGPKLDADAFQSLTQDVHAL
jgi:hypothetical protein